MIGVPYVVAVLLLGQVAAPAERYKQYKTPDGNPVIPAKIRVQDEASIPAPEPGVLMEFAIREGARLKKGDAIAVIDDREAKLGIEVAEIQEFVAKELAKEDIEERFAVATANLAKADVEKDLEANRKSKGAVAASEIARKKLDHKRSVLQIEKAQKDQKMAGLDVKVKGVELKAAKMSLERRAILAPFDGEVVKTFVHQSEWVSPGDPILKLMRFDKLYIEGALYADEYDRSEVLGKPVTVEVTKARGRKVSVEGKIVHVEQVLMGKRYTVRAEVDNQLENNSWLLQPGGSVWMTIQLNGAALAPKTVRRN